MASQIPDKTWQELLERDNYACLHCLSTENLTPAHYISKGQYPDHSLGNLMLLCWQCHRDSHDGRLAIKKIGERFYFKTIR